MVFGINDQIVTNTFADSTREVAGTGFGVNDLPVHDDQLAFPAESNYQRGFFANIDEAYKRGKENVLAEVAFYEALLKDSGDPEKAMSEALKLRKQDATDPIDGAFVADLVYGSSRVGGQWGQSVKSGGKGAAVAAGIGGAIGAGIGAVIPTIGEEPATAGAGAALGLKIGAKLGFAEGSALFMYKQGVGSMLLDMIESGYDVDTSKVIAQIAGIPYALLEAAQMKGAAPAVKGITEKVIAKSMPRILAQVTKRYGKKLSAEVLQEVAQEVVQIAAKDVAAEASNMGVRIDSDYFEQRAMQLLYTAKEAGKSMALLPIPGTAIETGLSMRLPQIAKDIEANPETFQGSPSSERNTITRLERDAEIYSDSARKTATISAPVPRETKTADYAQQLIEEGMEPQKAVAWAEKVMVDEAVETSPDMGVETTIEEAKNRVYEINRVVYEKQRSDLDLTNEMAQEYGISGPEAWEIIQSLRTQKPIAAPDIDADVLAEDLSKRGKQVDPDIIGGSKGLLQDTWDKVKDNAYGYHLGMSRMRNVIRSLDGKEDGALSQAILNPIRKGVAKSALMRSGRLGEFRQAMTNLDIDSKAFYAKNFKVPGSKKALSSSEKVEVFLATKDADKMRHLRQGNRFSKKQVSAVVNGMTEQELAVSNYILNYYDKDYAEIAPIYRSHKGKDLSKLPGYSRIFVARKGFANIPKDFSGLLDEEMETRKTGVAKGMVKRRTKSVLPIELDAIGNLMEHIRQAEHYKAMMPVAQSVGKTLNNKKLKRAIDLKTRGRGSGEMSKWMKDVLTERTTSDGTGFGRILGIVRKNVVVSSLGFNILTAFKQPVSISLALADDAALMPHVIKNLMINMNPSKHGELKTFVESRSDLIKTRSMAREIMELARSRDGKMLLKNSRGLSEKAMIPIQTMDRQTVRVLWKSDYDLAIKSMDEDAAIAHADRLIEKTQPMADIMDLPGFFRGGALEKLFTTFQNQINQNYNYWAYDVIGEKNPQKLAWKVLTAVVLPAYILSLISHGRQPTKEEMAKDLASFMIVPAFGVGQIASSMVQGFDPQVSPTFSALGYYKRGQWIRGTATLGGVPGTAQGSRTLNGVIDWAEGDTRDPRRLIWSEYALEED